MLSGLGKTMSEIIFEVEEAPEGGYTARALGYSLFTEGWHVRRTARDGS